VIGAHPLEGKAAPDFALAALDGSGTVSLAALRGRPVVINFWAPSCVPCREEFPLLKSALAAHAGSGLAVLGVIFHGGSFLDSPDDAARFMAEQGATWAALLDPDQAAQRAYGVQAPPLTFFVGRDGVVRAVQFGPPTAELLERHLAKIL